MLVISNTNHWSHLFIQIVVLLAILILKPISNNNGALNGEVLKDRQLNDYNDRQVCGAVACNPERDDLNLFNLFNVFRGSQSKLLDKQGNLIPLDTASEFHSPKQKLQEQQQQQHQDYLVSAKTDDKKLSTTSRGLNSLREFHKNHFNQLLVDSNVRFSETDDQLPILPSNVSTNESNSNQQLLSPVILVPGYAGSRLEARLHKPSVVRYFCDLESDWSDVWINMKLLLPYMIDCLIDNLRLEYNSVNRTTHNTAGVEIRVKNPNSISSVEYLHELPLSGFAYFAPIIEKLVNSFDGNYQREQNILGAPYDFRKAPNELADHFERIKTNTEMLLERTNNSKKITYICHSMGCNQMLFFLQRQSSEWKQKHVRRLISLAAPWAGSFSALRAAALGDNLGMPYLFSESKLIKVQRSVPSTIFLFPHKDVFSNVPLIRSNVATSRIRSRNSMLFGNRTNIRENQESIKHYTIDNIESLFRDINHPDGYQMWLDTKDLLGSLEPPGVELWCIVGRGQKTLGRMEFLGDFPHSQSRELYDDGDGTVTLESASYCKNWADKQEQKVIFKEFDLSHMGILKDHQTIDYVSWILQQE